MRGLVFPGQGSQSVGMGKSLFDGDPDCRTLFETADRVLGFPLSKVCFEGPEEELKRTPVTQPALLTTAFAAFRILEKGSFAFRAVAGHSLGAYTALAAAGALSFEEAVRLVRRRGELMEEAGRGKGTMAVILNLDEDKVVQACREASAQGVVEPANVNCPGQIVISGEKTAVAAACVKAKELGAKRAMEIPVSGPFHSSLMEPAGEGLAKELERAVWKEPRVPYYSDIDAEPLCDPSAIRESLVRQLTAPVQWTRLVRRMEADGVTELVEVGPGKVLSGLNRKISETLKLANVGELDTLKAILNS